MNQESLEKTLQDGRTWFQPERRSFGPKEKARSCARCRPSIMTTMPYAPRAGGTDRRCLPSSFPALVGLYWKGRRSRRLGRPSAGGWCGSGRYSARKALTPACLKKGLTRS